MFGNLFLHWLPVKVREKSLRVRAAYYLGSLSLLLFLLLVVTGVLLMFYYHPAAPKAYHDMKDLRFVVSNGVFLRNMHRIGAHLMVLLVFAHMFHVFYRGGYKPPHEFNWVVGVVLAAGHAVSQLHGLPAAVGSVGVLGGNRRNQHHFRHADHWQQDPLCGLGRQYCRRKCFAAILRAARGHSSVARFSFHWRAFLARAEGRRADGTVKRR